jgi:hypothetical protein
MKGARRSSTSSGVRIPPRSRKVTVPSRRICWRETLMVPVMAGTNPAARGS